MAKMIAEGNKYVLLLKLLVGNRHISIQRLNNITRQKMEENSGTGHC